jgi:hypothetical protein
LGEPWCLIGGLAINVYCEPVYTNDADFIVVISQLELVCAELASRLHHFQAPVLGQCATAGLQPHCAIHYRSRYQDFLARATPDGEVLGVQCRVAALTDLFQGKLWAAADPERRPTKRAKDELDLLRIADTYPKYLPLLPPALRARLGK